VCGGGGGFCSILSKQAPKRVRDWAKRGGVPHPVSVRRTERQGGGGVTSAMSASVLSSSSSGDSAEALLQEAPDLARLTLGESSLPALPLACNENKPWV